MSLIFDNFKTRQDAENFVEAVKTKFEMAGKVYDSQEESDKDDLFPFELTAPIVLIDRPQTDDDEAADAVESEIEALVEQYNGQFAGT